MKYKLIFLIFTFLLLLPSSIHSQSKSKQDSLKLLILGTSQDAGYPQLNCYKPHCMPAWENVELKKFATSLGIIDTKNRKKYLFEATPDIREQLYNFHTFANDKEYPLSGIFLTHAHMGHYTGLMHMGREAAGTKNLPVYAMPKMLKYLADNGPWSQLVTLKNIILNELTNNKILILSENFKVKPITVPHRDEFSETVGYKIFGPSKVALFIPDIDKWSKWNRNILDEIKLVDYALLDATFFANGEIPNRDMSEIPHPFVTESMDLFSTLPESERNKIIFIHFNHTNPLLQEGSKAQKQVIENGYKFAKQGMILDL